VDGPNLYAYVRQNPWTSFDPLGLDDENAGKTIAKAQQEKVDFVRSMGHDDIADAQQGLLDNGKSMANSTAQAMDAAVSMTPLGTANEVIFGENSMGEPLTWDARGMSAISAIPGGKYLDKLHDILGAAKATAGKTDEMVEAVLKNADAGAGKGPPNPGGRLGKESTRTHIDDVAAEMESRGFEITGGGNRLPEEYLPGPGGGRKGSSFPDITATKNGRTVRVNTVDTRVNGVTPTTREAANAARIRAQTPGDHLLLVPKPKS
jgi:hypothetical protein